MTPREKVDLYITGLIDWRGPMLTLLRGLFHEADPDVTEEWKWMGSPVWEHDGIPAVGMAFKNSVKLGFLYGVSLPDPDHIFNDEVAGSQRRAIKFYENDSINETALKALILAAVTRNHSAK